MSDYIITICVTLFILVLVCAIGCIGGPIAYEMRMDREERSLMRKLDAEHERRLANKQRLAEDERLAEEQRRKQARLGRPSISEAVRRAQQLTEEQTQAKVLAEEQSAKPLVGPFPEQDSGETEKDRILNRLIKAGIAVPAHGRG